MPRIKKILEDETTSRPVRRTRQSSLVTDSPVRRSTRNKPTIDSSPETVNEDSIVSKRVLRKRTPTPDLDASKQPTRALRKRNVKADSEAPPTPTRSTRRTRANSVTESIKISGKKSTATPVKERRRLISVPTEPSLVEEDKDDIETSDKSDNNQNSPYESPDKKSDDQFEETTAVSQEEEAEESSTSFAELASTEDSILIVDEITGVKSVIKKKEKSIPIKERLMNRLIASKLNCSNNDSFADLKTSNVSDPKMKKERVSVGEKLLNSSSGDETAKDSEENLEVEQKSDTGVLKQKTPRRRSGKKSMEDDSSEENESKEDDFNDVESLGKIVRESPNKKESSFKTLTPNKIETPNRKETLNKTKTPNKKETLNKTKTPSKKETHNKTNTPGKINTPEIINTLNKSKTPKDRTPVKRFSNSLTVEENQDLIDETKDENSFEEPMDIDESDESVANNSMHHEIDTENIETIDLPERMSCNFKSRKSMIEIASEKLSVSKSRNSLGSKKLESVTFDIAKEKQKHLQKENRKSLQNIDSVSDNLESNYSATDLPSKESFFQISPISERKSSVEKRKSTPDKRESISKKKDSFILSNSPTPNQLANTPMKDNLSKSKDKMMISLSKSSEKCSRKRKREESSDSDYSYQLSMLGYDEESFLERDVDKLDSTLYQNKSVGEEKTPINRKSLNKNKSKSLDANEFMKVGRNELEKKKTSNRSLQVSQVQENERTPKNKNKSLLMSESLEEGEIRNSEEKNGLSDEENSKISDKNYKRRSKSKSFGVTESEKEETEIPKNEKSLDTKRLSNLLEKKFKEFENNEPENLQKSSENEEDADSESEVEKPDSKNQKIKKADEKKLREAEGNEESSKEESTDDEVAIVTVKKARKSQSIGTTPSLSPKKSRLYKLKERKGIKKKSKLKGLLGEEDSEDVESQIPTFMFSQTSSESENDEDDSAEESSGSIDSDIAREYNLAGEDITHYSDDDVPADNCRASETEHSDSEDDGSDLADFIVDEVEDEESDDDSVFDAKQAKIDEEQDETVDEEAAEEQSPPEDKKSRRSQNSLLKVIETDQDRQIQDQEANSHEDEKPVQEDKKESPEFHLSSEESELESSTHQKSNGFESSKSPIQEAEPQNNLDVSLIKENKEKEPELSNSKYESKEEGELMEIDTDQKRKTRKKSKRELRATVSKTPVASSTRYEISDSQDEPDSLSFEAARNETLEAQKKRTKSIKAGKEGKKKKKVQGEKAKVEINSINVKRLPDEIIQDLEDVSRPKKRQKISKKESFAKPSLGMHDLNCNHSLRQENLATASSCGSTTDFEVVSLQKEKKPKAQSSLALKWFKQRMLARNIRQPVSAYLSQQQKRKAAGKDHF